MASSTECFSQTQQCLVCAFASDKLLTKTPSNTWEKLFLKDDFFKNNLKTKENVLSDYTGHVQIHFF